MVLQILLSVTLYVHCLCCVMYVLVSVCRLMRAPALSLTTFEDINRL